MTLSVAVICLQTRIPPNVDPAKKITSKNGVFRTQESYFNGIEGYLIVHPWSVLLILNFGSVPQRYEICQTHGFTLSMTTFILSTTDAGKKMYTYYELTIQMAEVGSKIDKRICLAQNSKTTTVLFGSSKSLFK